MKKIQKLNKTLFFEKNVNEWNTFLKLRRRMKKKINNILKTTKIVIFQIMYACRKKNVAENHIHTYTHSNVEIYT